MTDLESLTLFEDDYLIRTAGHVATLPDYALTELVANAWDAGASNVNIFIPYEKGIELTIEDDGCGMTHEQFRNRWMTLGYNRLKRQGKFADCSDDAKAKKRLAYGRNGIGRHGMLCFADEYSVQTTRDGIRNRYLIKITSGTNPFQIVEHFHEPEKGQGTRISATVTKNLPPVEQIRELLTARFIADPEFNIVINNIKLEPENLSALVDEETITIRDNVQLEMLVYDSEKKARARFAHGLAFWVGNRLVGRPGWTINGRSLLDGRTNLARTNTIIIKSDDLYEEVLADWSGFRQSQLMAEVYQRVAEHIGVYIRKKSVNQIDRTRTAAIIENRKEIEDLNPAARHQVAEFIEDITDAQPLVSADWLSAAVKTMVTIEKKRSGAELLMRLIKMSDDDIEGLNKILDEWSVKDALYVLNEIDRRIAIIEALERLCGDPKVDELHTLHPLITEATWLFGPEYDSPLYASNVSIRNAAEKVFGQAIDKEHFIDPRKRPDLVVLKDSTISLVGSEEIPPDSNISQVKRILLIELKRGGHTISRKEIEQTSGYAEDLIGCGIINSTAYIEGFVVGHAVDSKITPYREIGKDPVKAKIQACTFSGLIMTASKRLFSLRTELNNRYNAIQTETLIDKALKNPEQITLEEFGVSMAQ